MSVDLTPYLSMSGNDVHCWNLVERFYLNEFGIEVPNYDSSISWMPTLADRDLVLERWDELYCAVDWIAVDAPKPFDLIDFWTLGMPHVGIQLERPSLMLHKSGKYTRVQDYRGETWQRLIRGYYRHPRMA